MTGVGNFMALMDEVLLAVVDQKPIPTNAIDRLPPWRARLVVRVALAAGGTLQHGTPEQFEQAVRAAGKGKRDPYTDGGWWRAALGMEPREQLPPPPTAGEYIPSAGWRVAGGARPAGPRT